MKKIITALALMVLCSCSTPYQAKGFRGGFTEQKLSSDMFSVSFSGNGYTGAATVQNYLLKRCAELTMLNGYTHFILIGSNGSTETTFHSTYSAKGQGNIYSVNAHTNQATIKMISNPPKDMVAYDAEVIFGPLPDRGTASLPSNEEVDEVVKK